MTPTPGELLPPHTYDEQIEIVTAVKDGRKVRAIGRITHGKYDANVPETLNFEAYRYEVVQEPFESWFCVWPDKSTQRCRSREKAEEIVKDSLHGARAVLLREVQQ